MRTRGLASTTSAGSMSKMDCSSRPSMASVSSRAVLVRKDAASSGLPASSSKGTAAPSWPR